MCSFDLRYDIDTEHKPCRKKYGQHDTRKTRGETNMFFIAAQRAITRLLLLKKYRQRTSENCPGVAGIEAPRTFG